MQGFFETGSGSSKPEDLAGKGSFWLMLGISEFFFYFYIILLMYLENLIDTPI